jgi:hypothetical protein
MAVNPVEWSVRLSEVFTGRSDQEWTVEASCEWDAAQSAKSRFSRQHVTRVRVDCIGLDWILEFDEGHMKGRIGAVVRVRAMGPDDQTRTR